MRGLLGNWQSYRDVDNLDEFAELVAKVSSLGERFIRNFVHDAVVGKTPMRILKVGCGSGVYLRAAVESNPEATGVGIDLDDKVVAQAQQNLKDWGIDDRFKVMVGNILLPSDDWQGPFDLISLYNVVYYFPVEERLALFRSLRSMLAPDGALAIVSSMQDGGKSVWMANLDLVTRSTVGCAPLPKLEELVAQLRQSGFSRIDKVQLLPGNSFYGILAR